MAHNALDRAQPSMKRQCILVAAHQRNEKTADILRTLKTQCGHAFDIHLLFDNTRGAYDRDFLPDIDTHLFDCAGLSRRYDLYSCHESGGIVPGNCIFPFLDFLYGHAYETAWCLEYDVWFSGAWPALFDSFAQNRSGLLATTLRTQERHPNWFWWKSLKAPADLGDSYRRLAAFLPLFRLTRHAVEGLEAAYAAGWKGHTEAAVPTIIDHLGLGVEDIGETTFAGSQQKRFYANSIGRPRLSPGTFVCPPADFSPVYHDNCLYHPVKHIDDIARIGRQDLAAEIAVSTG